MDKKIKKKVIPAIGFIMVCGVVCLGLHYGGQGKKEILMEKVPQQSGNATENSFENVPMVTDTVNPEEKKEPILYVHICGAVKEEGVYVLPAESRLQDGIAAAGGFREDADRLFHNLAAPLKDGQRVYVPTKEETKDVSVEERTEGTSDWFYGEESNGNQPVNINTADLEQLMTLSGIGEAKAKSILQYREKVGGFQSIEEIKNVSGIGDAMFERIKEDIVAE